MKKSYYMLLAALSLLGTGCSHDEFIGENSEYQNNGITILQERNPNLPQTVVTRPVEVEDKNRTRGMGENGENIGDTDALLGCSYIVGNSILGDYINVQSPIIDIAKVKEYGVGYAYSHSLRYFSAERFSYCNYEKYETKLRESKKVSSGFQVNLGLFKFGRKKETETIFNSDHISEQNVVYGELNMLYNNSLFALQVSEGARKFYAQACMSQVFLRNLYTSTLGSILDTYGDFVLTGYITGGKSVALYKGECIGDYDMASKEKKMNKNIDASFAWNKKDSAKINYSFGGGDYRLDSAEYKMDNIYTKLYNYGGKALEIAMSSADELKNISFDMGPWVSSLSDSKEHTIIDIAENGLCPLSAFVLEENFKRRFDNTSLGINEGYQSLSLPHIEIMRVFDRYSSSGEALYDIVPVLFTRQRDRIILRSGNKATEAELRSYENATTFNERALEIKNQKQAFYDLRISSNSIARLNPLVSQPLCVDLPKVDESSMYVYTNPQTGIQYIYDTKNRIAFSHYTDDIYGDWILDDYGIRDWVESLPQRNISMASLASFYTIIGL